MRLLKGAKLNENQSDCCQFCDDHNDGSYFQTSLVPECKLFTPDGDGRERKGEGDQSSRVIPGIFVQF